MTNWQENRIQSAIDGTNPMVMAELTGGYAVFFLRHIWNKFPR